MSLITLVALVPKLRLGTRGIEAPLRAARGYASNERYRTEESPCQAEFGGDRVPKQSLGTREKTTRRAQVQEVSNIIRAFAKLLPSRLKLVQQVV